MKKQVDASSYTTRWDTTPVGLATLDVTLHVARLHQPNLMPQIGELTPARIVSRAFAEPRLPGSAIIECFPR